MMFDAIAHKIIDQTIDLNHVTITLRRLDLIHPHISGNKFFKLKYNLLQAQQQGYKQLITFGGAYSNHIAATAFAASHFNFQSIGIIRGEELAYKTLNATLQTAQDFGMQLHFIPRQLYRKKHLPEIMSAFAQQFPDSCFIPEGGTNSFAIQGCSEILTPKDHQFDVICCAVGTGGTIAGLIEASQPQQQVLGFSALKGNFLNHEVAQLTTKTNWNISDAYCCGGYAKTIPELLQFIRNFEATYHIPLEQIYTGKMLMGIFDLVHQGYFKAHSRLLVLHTGGLQGKIEHL